MRWERHVARIGEERKLYKVFFRESPKETHFSEDQGVYWRRDKNGS
jgi:hypothetical protein